MANMLVPEDGVAPNFEHAAAEGTQKRDRPFQLCEDVVPRFDFVFYCLLLP